MNELNDAEQHLWHVWKRAADTVRSRVGDDLAEATGLSDPEYGILTRIEDLGNGVVAQSELASSMGWHRSRLSHQLTRMQERGFVVRDERRGPGVVVSITRTGAEAVAAARPVLAAAVRKHLIKKVHTADFDRTIALLEHLTQPE